MQVVAAADENSKPWRLRDALREKGGLSDAQIVKLLASTKPLELVELALGLEEAHGIEIVDEDFLAGKSAQDRFGRLAKLTLPCSITRMGRLPRHGKTSL
jgi:hypothetical protein